MLHQAKHNPHHLQLLRADLLQVADIGEEHVHEVAKSLADELLLPLALQVHDEVAQHQLYAFVGLLV